MYHLTNVRTSFWGIYSSNFVGVSPAKLVIFPPLFLPVQLHCQHRTTCFAQLVQGAAHAVWCHGPREGTTLQ